VAPAPPPQNVAVTASVASAASIAQAQAGGDGERAPRKSRRRRGGRRIDPAVDQGKRAVEAPSLASASSAGESKASPVQTSLLARIGKGLKSLVTRAPRSHH